MAYQVINPIKPVAVAFVKNSIEGIMNRTSGYAEWYSPCIVSKIVIIVSAITETSSSLIHFQVSNS
jgi:hypothetical protein